MAFRNLRSVISMVCAGNYAVIVQHWRINDSIIPGQFGLAKSLRDALIAPVSGDSVCEMLAACMGDDCYLSGIRVKEFSPLVATSTAVVLLPTTDFPGDFGGTIDAAQVAGCVIWVPSTATAESGRNFLPGVSEDAIESGLFVDAYRDALGPYVDAMLAGVVGTAGTFEFCLRHTPNTFTPIAHGYLSPTPGTIKKRLVPW